MRAKEETEVRSEGKRERENGREGGREGGKARERERERERERKRQREREPLLRGNNPGAAPAAAHLGRVEPQGLLRYIEIYRDIKLGAAAHLGRVEPQADAGARAAGAAGALVGGGLGDGDHVERLHTALRVVDLVYYNII